MKIGVLGFNLSSKDKVQINRILVGYDLLTEHSVVITDVRSINVQIAISNQDIVIAFGNWAANAGRRRAKHKGILYVELPDVKKLYAPIEGGQPGARERAAETLNSLKSAMKSGTLRVVDDRKILDSIPKDAVVDLSAGVIQKLQQKLVETGRAEWTCVTESGYSVHVSLDPANTDPSFDINITFDELFALRTFMDVFKAREVRFVPTSPTNNQNHSVSDSPSSGNRDVEVHG